MNIYVHSCRLTEISAKCTNDLVIPSKKRPCDHCYHLGENYLNKRHNHPDKHELKGLIRHSD